MRTQVLASALFRGTSSSGGNAEMKGEAFGKAPVTVNLAPFHWGKFRI